MRPPPRKRDPSPCNRWTLRRVKAEPVSYKGRKALRLASEGDGNGIAIVAGTQFQDGTLEVDLAGEPGPGAQSAARGFVDQERRNHSTQSDSFPDYLVPGEWTRLTITVSGVKANGAIALWIGPGAVAHFSNLRAS